VFTVIDRYILKQIVLPLIAAMATGLLLLLAERMVRLLDTTLGKKNSFSIVFELLAYLVPHYLGLAIPAALFLGLLFGFNRLSNDSEVEVLLASGAGLHRLMRPAFALAILIALGSFAIFGWAQPYTRYAYRSVLFGLKNVEVFYLAREGVFMQAGSRTFILDELDRRRSAFSRIFLFDYRGAGGAETVTATRGTLIQVPGQRRPVLRLEEGHRMTLRSWPDPASSTAPPSAAVTAFRSAETPVGKETDKAFHPRGEDERELTLPELVANQGGAMRGATAATMQMELHKRIINIITPMMLPFLAVPFAVGRRRSRRAYQFGIALVILIALHETVQQGAIASVASGISPWFSMWTPFLAVTGFAFWRFWRTAFHVPYGHFEEGLDNLAEACSAAFATLLRRLRPRAAS
jgi:lipopolysaccharide export system permease protein